MKFAHANVMIFLAAIVPKRRRYSCALSIFHFYLFIKVPALEIKFLVDQRTKRKMKIGKVDKRESAKIQHRQERAAQRRVCLLISLLLY